MVDGIEKTDLATSGNAHVNPADERSADLRHVEQDEIAKLAYMRWQERGSPDGSSEDDWFAAEHEYALRFR